MNTAIIVDTGALYGIADESDSWHKRIKSFLDGNRASLIVPVTVLPEACYLLNTYLGVQAEQELLMSSVQGEIKIENIAKEDMHRIVELLICFNDANIGFVDASIVAIAERLKISHVLTTDRRHFSLFRPHHCASFTLLP